MSKHLIEYNGVQYRVRTKCRFLWKVERVLLARDIPEDLTFDDYQQALKWIRQEYGCSATIQPRTWRTA